MGIIHNAHLFSHILLNDDYSKIFDCMIASINRQLLL
jgi:hypothetical protein